MKKISKVIKGHKKCISGSYMTAPKDFKRYPLTSDTSPWSHELPDYKPSPFGSSVLRKKPPWADPEMDDPKFLEIKWNQIDGQVNRKSFLGKYKLIDKRPVNPIGRTGISERGVLGKWGPNHAADPIVTRWKQKENKQVMHPDSKKPILQFVGIKRGDTGEWAIPGGMVDAGEVISQTLQREFGEEALSSHVGGPPSKKMKVQNSVDDLFKNGTEIYKGYVDDPRNTDNAWIETTALNFHDEDGSLTGKIKLHAGDDAVGVRWIDIDQSLELYASHIEFIKKTTEIHEAHW